MPMPLGEATGKLIVILAVVLTIIMIVPGIQASFYPGSPPDSLQIASHDIENGLERVNFLGSIIGSGSTYNKSTHIVVILNYSNQTRLDNFLSNLSNPSSPYYHHYMTASQFDANFSPSPALYNSAVSYFARSGMYNITTFPDRSVIAMEGTSGAVYKAFHTNMSVGQVNGSITVGPQSYPALPSWLATSVYDVVGLSNSAKVSFSLNLEDALSSAQAKGVLSSGISYPAPRFQKQINAQVIFGTDLQVTYNETQLFGNHYDRGEVIATLLWSGNYTNAQGVSVPTAPFNPSDLNYYFNNTYPTYSNGTLAEPLPNVSGVPILGAPSPGPSAAKDTSGATLENTLDLEMVGSMAPGAQIFNVYGPNPSVSDLTQAFATVLSPPSGAPQELLNTTVISNSWGGSDGTDSAWNTMLQQAQARGITVLASSGDSGDSQHSPKYAGGPDIVQFPSTDANNTYGVTAVGGTNLSINSTTLDFITQQAWYVNSTHSIVGSTGGISSVYTEPSWQLNSVANLTLKGQGRGVPDISAIANNTVIYYSNKTASNFYIVSGTSISSPVEAGLVATMDAYLNASGETPLGFIDPLIYRLGTDQYDPSYPGYAPLKNDPFFNVSPGHNYLYNVTPLGRPGYNLVTGMGSINAWNFLADSNIKRYNVTFVESGLKSGTPWSVEISGRAFTSGKNSRYVNLSLPNGTYDFRIPHVDHMVAVPPQDSIIVNGENITFQVVFKYGYVVNFTQDGLPLNKTWSLSAWFYTRQFSGNSGTLYFPNGSYNYTATPSDLNYYGESGIFTVNGSPETVNMTFRHGRFNVSFLEKGLDPGQEWRVRATNETSSLTISNTTDNITFYLYGGEYTFYIYPSGKDAPNLSVITLNTNGQNQTVEVNFSYGYFVTFREVGLSVGTAWGISFNGLNNMTTNTTVEFEVPNGSYRYSTLGNETPYSASSGTVNVTGSNVTVVISYSKPNSFLGTEILYLVLLFLAIVLLVSGVSLLRRR